MTGKDPHSFEMKITVLFLTKKVTNFSLGVEEVENFATHKLPLDLMSKNNNYLLTFGFYWVALGLVRRVVASLFPASVDPAVLTLSLVVGCAALLNELSIYLSM